MAWLHSLSTADKIALFSAFGAWLSGIGTLAAVIVALYLAWKDRLVRLKVSAGHRVVGCGPNISEYADTCVIRVTNTGSRKVTVTGVGWRFGRLKKNVLLQTLILPAMPSPMPITLGDGDEATWHIPFKIEGERDWLAEFASTLKDDPVTNVKTLQVFVYTTVGKPIVGIVEKPLKDMMLEAAQKGDGTTEGK